MTAAPQGGWLCWLVPLVQSCWNGSLHMNSMRDWDLMGSSSALAGPGDLGSQGAQEVLVCPVPISNEGIAGRVSSQTSKVE